MPNSDRLSCDSPTCFFQEALHILNVKFPDSNNVSLSLLFKTELQIQALGILIEFHNINTATIATEVALNFHTSANIQNLTWLAGINLSATPNYILSVISWPPLQIPEPDFTLTPRSPLLADHQDIDLLSVLVGQQPYEELKSTKRDCHLCVIM